VSFSLCLSSNSGLNDFSSNNINCNFCLHTKSTFNSFLADFNNIKIKIPFTPHSMFNNFNILFNSDNCLNIYYQSIRGPRTKLFNLPTNFILAFYDAYTHTETWLSNDILNAELGFDGYLIFRCDRNVHTSNRLTGGGDVNWSKERAKTCLNYDPVWYMWTSFCSLYPS